MHEVLFVMVTRDVCLLKTKLYMQLFYAFYLRVTKDVTVVYFY